MDQSIQTYLKPELDEASKELLAMADKMERDGWCQYKVVDAHGRVCIVGSHIGYEYVEVMFRLRANLGVASNGGVIDWNNAPGRTQAEVVAKLRSVALGGA